MFRSANYSDAIQLLMAGLGQLRPDGNSCAICGDSGHQAWECQDNPLVKMARADKADTEWRCFICGEIFTNEEAAFLHFGMDASTPPGCRCDDLTTLLRWAEVQKHNQTAARPDTNIHKRPLVTVWDQIISKITDLRNTAALRQAS